MFEKSYYCCEICKAEYSTPEEALQCESLGIEDKFPVGIKAGDTVNFLDTTYEVPSKGIVLGKIFVMIVHHQKHLAVLVLDCEIPNAEGNKMMKAERGVILQPMQNQKGEIDLKCVSHNDLMWKPGFYNMTQTAYRNVDTSKSSEQTKEMPLKEPKGISEI